VSSAEWKPSHQSAEGQPWDIEAAAGLFQAGGGGIWGRR